MIAGKSATMGIHQNANVAGMFDAYVFVGQTPDEQPEKRARVVILLPEEMLTDDQFDLAKYLLAQANTRFEGGGFKFGISQEAAEHFAADLREKGTADVPRFVRWPCELWEETRNVSGL